MPYHIVVKVLGGNPTEADVDHSLESGMVIVRGLNVEALRRVTIARDSNMGNAIGISQLAEASVRIGDEDRTSLDVTIQHTAQVLAGRLSKVRDTTNRHMVKIDSASDANLFVRKSTLGCLPTMSP